MNAEHIPPSIKTPELSSKCVNFHKFALILSNYVKALINPVEGL